MTRIFSCAALTALLALPLASNANDFGLSYDVDRVDASRLSLAECGTAISRGATSLGYVTRAHDAQDQLITHVSGPQGDGSAVIAYCIGAGDQTVFVVQALDYSGPGTADAERVKARVTSEIRKAITPAD